MTAYLYKFRRRNLLYDPAKPLSTAPEWVVMRSSVPITSLEEAEIAAQEMSRRTGYRWEAVVA